MTIPPVCDYEGSNYQHSFWDTGQRAYEDAAEMLALKHLLTDGGKRLLELGAGAGRNTPRYSGFDQVVLLDYSTTQLAQARQRLGSDSRYLFIAADAYRLPFADAQFDAATIIRTLHHFKDAPLALEQTRRVLADGATLLLEFANKRNLKAMLRYLLRQQSWSPYTLEQVEFATLNFDFHPRQVNIWLEQRGFIIERRLAVSLFRLSFLKRVFPLRALLALESTFQILGACCPVSPSVFLRARVPGQSADLPEKLTFRCPACLSLELKETKVAISCRACGRVYPLQEGIYNFKVND
jgi:SAM-dependent methyltransferase